MVPLRIAAGLVIAGLAITSGLFGRPDMMSPVAQDSSAPAKSLFSQSAVLVLEREFSNVIVAVGNCSMSVYFVATK